MSMDTTIRLGVLMAAIAVVNASLMAWLWRFPMKDGVSTAPRLWTNVHRGLGYVFVIAYGALLVEMLPRMWEFRVASTVGVVHGALGVLVGIILAFKIAVIRRIPSLGHRLPWIGGALVVTTLTVSALGVVPAWMLLRPAAPLSPELARGRDVVARKCQQCHGASVILSEEEDARKWLRITEEMQRFSRKIPGKDAITDEERMAAAAYLAYRLPGDDDHDEDEDDDGGGRRRRRNRGRR